MSRPWQIFVAPGDEETPLPSPPSPWILDRWVQLPREHWQLILDFAEAIDPNLTERLRWSSGGAYPSESDRIPLSASELRELIGFLTKVRAELLAADPLVPEPTKEVPDAFVNEEHARMVENVITVMEEALRLGEPFRAWNEW